MTNGMTNRQVALMAAVQLRARTGADGDVVLRLAERFNGWLENRPAPPQDAPAPQSKPLDLGTQETTFYA